ncbi:Hypothetical predicted protein [Cloeon dipterum]|uniref:Uncharacterized protein n=1 Tax=Cloeon dipterum TaxID=197152 RepID=A0A8S1CF94_9INSE|nr:Hypothetical predicted protein [Cloeon dipterum]
MTGHAPLCVILTPYSSSREREIRSECGGVCFSRDRTHTDTVRVSCQEVYLEAVVSAKPNVHVVGRISTSDLVPDGAVEHDNRHAGAGRRLLDIAEAHSERDLSASFCSRCSDWHWFIWQAVHIPLSLCAAAAQLRKGRCRARSLFSLRSLPLSALPLTLQSLLRRLRVPCARPDSAT